MNFVRFLFSSSHKSRWLTVDPTCTEARQRLGKRSLLLCSRLSCSVFLRATTGCVPYFLVTPTASASSAFSLMLPQPSLLLPSLYPPFCWKCLQGNWAEMSDLSGVGKPQTLLRGKISPQSQLYPEPSRPSPITIILNVYCLPSDLSAFKYSA